MQTQAGTPNPTQGKHPHVRNIALDLVFATLTCGLYGLYVEYRQIQAVNDMIGQPRYEFGRWLLLTIVTCSIYNAYHEYRKAQDICRVMKKPETTEPVVSLVLSLFTFNIVADAIQQIDINRYYGSDEL